MKKILLLIICIMGITSIAAMAGDANEMILKLKNSHPQKETLQKSFSAIKEACLILNNEPENDELLTAIVIYYSKTAVINSNHQPYEYLMPYYQKYPSKVNATLDRWLNKKEKEHFLERMETIIREYAQGNG